MRTDGLPYRQVHLDFHTSPLIPDVGRDFDPEEFVRTLKLGHVNSVTCFAKCHHGMSYYDTKIGKRHPSLTFDLLGEQIRACRAAGIAVPIYYSIVWDNYNAEQHPDWRQIARDGRPRGPGPLEIGEYGGWKCMCMNTPYADLVQAQVEEIMDMFEVEGFFFDIVRQMDPGCCCPHCLRSMKERGLDPTSDDDLRKMSRIIVDGFRQRITSAIRAKNPDVRIFYNGCVRMDMRSAVEQMTHVEIEALPSGGWGYAFFPFFVRYARQFPPSGMTGRCSRTGRSTSAGLGIETLGMTGRFVRSWADFGGIKPEAALDFECSTMLANGSRCSIGDQMHPRGRLDRAVYETIGKVYSRVEQVEPWCRDAAPQTQVALLVLPGPAGYKTPGDEGAAKMLLETHQQFDVLDGSMDIDRYDLVLVADNGEAAPEIRDKIGRYLDNGGRLIFSHKALLTEDGQFPDYLGVRYIGEVELYPDFFRPGPLISAGIPDFGYVLYGRSSRVEPLAGAEILADAYQPYFNRTWEHFTSHSYTCIDRKAPYPAVVRAGSAIYIHGPIFEAYQTYESTVYRKLVENCMDLLLPNRLLGTSAPPSSEVTLLAQEGRRIVHIVNYSPNRRSGRVEVIEQPIPLYGIRLDLRTEEPVSRVYLVPEMQDLEFERDGGVVSCVVPKVKTHAMVVFE